MTDRIRPGIPRYRAADVAVLRIPALPADGCTGLLAACRPDDPDWPATHRALLADAWRTPLLAAAVEHSAPDLARALTEAGGPDGPRTALALDRCLNRLSTRPTPFGLAAAVAAVPVARAGRPTGTDPGGHLLRLSGPARPV
ncbi:lantibiotic dehydratase, partial [Kitasatospora sp. MBT63]